MKKTSYRNKPPEKLEKIPPCDLPSVVDAEEGYSGSSQGAGSAGFIVGDPVTYHEQEGDPIFLEDKRRPARSKLDFESLMKALVGISDEMDKQHDIQLANFADFLIKKTALQRSLNYSGLFRDLLVKIVESDIVNQNEALISITKEYNNILKLYMNSNYDISEASMEAYQKAMLKAEKYVR